MEKTISDIFILISLIILSGFVSFLGYGLVKYEKLHIKIKHFFIKVYYHVVYGAFPLHIVDSFMFKRGDVVKIMNVQSHGISRMYRILYITDNYLVIKPIEYEL